MNCKADRRSADDFVLSMDYNRVPRRPGGSCSAAATAAAAGNVNIGQKTRDATTNSTSTPFRGSPAVARAANGIIIAPPQPLTSQESIERSDRSVTEAATESSSSSSSLATCSNKFSKQQQNFDTGPFESFIVVALSTLLTVLLAWRVLFSSSPNHPDVIAIGDAERQRKNSIPILLKEAVKESKMDEEAGSSRNSENLFDFADDQTPAESNEDAENFQDFTDDPTPAEACATISRSFALMLNTDGYDDSDVSTSDHGLPQYLDTITEEDSDELRSNSSSNESRSSRSPAPARPIEEQLSEIRNRLQNHELDMESSSKQRPLAIVAPHEDHRAAVKASSLKAVQLLLPVEATAAGNASVIESAEYKEKLKRNKFQIEFHANGESRLLEAQPPRFSNADETHLNGNFGESERSPKVCSPADDEEIRNISPSQLMDFADFSDDEDYYESNDDNDKYLHGKHSALCCDRNAANANRLEISKQVTDSDGPDDVDDDDGDGDEAGGRTEPLYRTPCISYAVRRANECVSDTHTASNLNNACNSDVNENNVAFIANNVEANGTRVGAILNNIETNGTHVGANLNKTHNVETNGTQVGRNLNKTDNFGANLNKTDNNGVKRTQVEANLIKTDNIETIETRVGANLDKNRLATNSQSDLDKNRLATNSNPDLDKNHLANSYSRADANLNKTRNIGANEKKTRFLIAEKEDEISIGEKQEEQNENLASRDEKFENLKNRKTAAILNFENQSGLKNFENQTDRHSNDSRPFSSFSCSTSNFLVFNSHQNQRDDNKRIMDINYRSSLAKVRRNHRIYRDALESGMEEFNADLREQRRRYYEEQLAEADDLEPNEFAEADDLLTGVLEPNELADADDQNFLEKQEFSGFKPETGMTNEK